MAESRKGSPPSGQGKGVNARFSQRDLAARLGVHESQVSRDERNEYHGITLERAGRVLDALKVKLQTEVEMEKGMAVA